MCRETSWKSQKNMSLLAAEMTEKSTVYPVFFNLVMPFDCRFSKSQEVQLEGQ